MINYTAFLPASSRLRHALPGKLPTLAAVLVAAACSLAGLATPAGAEVAEVAGTTVGLQPRNGTTITEGQPSTFANNEGHAVLHGTSVYAIYWDPRDLYHHEWLVKLDTFFQQMGSASGSFSTVFDNLAQYRDRSNKGAVYQTVFKGSYSDTAKYPLAGCTDPSPLARGAVTCLTDSQLRQQLQSFIASLNLPKGMNTVYYLLTPPGVTTCIDAAATRCSDYSISEKEEEEDKRNSASYKNSFCSYHADINPDNAQEGDGNTILYAAIPWTAGTLGDYFDAASTRAYSQGYDCQDGGFDPTHEESREESHELSAAERETLEKESPKAQEEALAKLRLEGPHQQEPNQEGKGEEGDYSAGLADLIINQVAEEQQNTVTDPLLDGWQDASRHEVTDECRNFFASTAGDVSIGGELSGQEKTEAGTLSNETVGSGRYYLNNSFDLSNEKLERGVCVGGVGLVPRFTAPNPVNSGETVGFDGMESSSSLLEGESFGASGPPVPTYATFAWNFGDGTPEVKGYAPGAPLCEAPWLSPCAGSIFHAYQYAGTYPVTLTVTDVAGDVSRIAHEVTVTGTPAPGSAPVSVGASGASGVGSTGALPAGTPGGPGGPIVAIKPVAQAAVLSHSLRTSLKKGLTVRYSVNEQVAGHFEVLISRALAKRLGVGGSPANGLPSGTAPQLMIAKALLITTKGGHGTVAIRFSSAVARHLSRTHKLSLLLRLIVRDASKSPVSTTVLSSVVLTG